MSGTKAGNPPIKFAGRSFAESSAHESPVAFRMESRRKGVAGCKLDYARRNKCSGVRICVERRGEIYLRRAWRPLVELHFY